MTEDFPVLHASRIRGVLPLGLAQSLASPEVLEGLQADGLLRVGARGAALTADGLARHAELLEAHRSGSDVATLAATYERFLTLNAPVKAACADWQQSARDPEALFMVADQLTEYLARLRPALTRAAEVAPWLGEYRVRLTAAAEQAMEGDGRFVTDPQVDSFHSIWFECHEDYLVTLGRTREEEEA